MFRNDDSGGNGFESINTIHTKTSQIQLHKFREIGHIHIHKSASYAAGSAC